MSFDSETMAYRDYRLTAVHQGAFWQVAVVPTRPDQKEANLPIIQDADKDAAIQKARDLVDEIFDGPGLC